MLRKLLGAILALCFACSAFAADQIPLKRNNGIPAAMTTGDTVGVGHGGTGATTETAHGVLVGQGTSPIAATAAGSAGQPLLSSGASADPVYGTLSASFGGTGLTSLTTHCVVVGQGTSAAHLVCPSTANQVLLDQGASSDPVFGALPCGALPAQTGDVVTSGCAATIQANAVTTSKINNAAVTLAKIANASASSKLLGSGSSGSGSPYAEITIGSNLSMVGTTLNASGTTGGSGLYFNQLSATPTLSSTGLGAHSAGTVTASDTTAGVFLAGSGNAAVWTNSVPATPYSFTVLFLTYNGGLGGPGWTDGTKFQFMYLNTNGNINVQNNSAYNTYNATLYNTFCCSYGALVWMKIRDDGTNVYFMISVDGVNYSTPYSVAKSSGYLGSSGYSHITISGSNGTVISWTQGT